VCPGHWETICQAILDVSEDDVDLIVNDPLERDDT
jgi:hypothetical protein